MTSAIPEIAIARGIQVGELFRAKKMNRTELAYGGHLVALGVYDWIMFEAITFTLGPDVRYTPDFACKRIDNAALEVHEVKGYMRDDARVKVRVACRIFPFVFFVAYLDKREKSGWRVEPIEP